MCERSAEQVLALAPRRISTEQILMKHDRSTRLSESSDVLLASEQQERIERCFVPRRSHGQRDVVGIGAAINRSRCSGVVPDVLGIERSDLCPEFLHNPPAIGLNAHCGNVPGETCLGAISGN
jgi:hypothetical protein